MFRSLIQLTIHFTYPPNPHCLPLVPTVAPPVMDEVRMTGPHPPQRAAYLGDKPTKASIHNNKSTTG